MRSKVNTAIIGLVSLLSMGAATAGEGVQVRITNDGTEAIVVTVYDMSTRPQRVVLENTRINGFTSVPINVIGDSTGRANLWWTATSLDGNSRHCGHDEAAVGDDASLNVHADSSCSV